MQSRLVIDTKNNSTSLLTSHRVLRNTYFLLALTLVFSAIVATVTMQLGLPRPSLFVTLVGFYGLLYLTNVTSNNGLGILSIFAFTGFLGYTLGPILNAYVSVGLSDLIILSLTGTAIVFFACSAYVLTTKKNMSFLSGSILALFIVLLLGMLATLFFHIPALYVGISALFVVFSTMGILYQTSEIIHGGEANYIRATIGIFVSLYNLFVSLLNLLSILRR